MQRTARNPSPPRALTALAAALPITLALALAGCDATPSGPPPRASADVKTGESAGEPPAIADANNLPSVGGDQWALDDGEAGDAAGGTLDEVPIETSSEGAWVIRRGQGRTRLLGIGVAEGGGSGGLGPRGTGRGGGGTGVGSIGYGSGPGAMSEEAADGAPPTRSRPKAKRTADAAKAPSLDALLDPASAATPSPSPSPSPSQSPLKAGATDDNADFKGFLEYLEQTRARVDLRDVFQDVDVRQRRFIAVTDRAGAPLPGARVAVVDPQTGRAGWMATTYGDGVAPFYPAIGFPEHSQRPSATYHVEVDYGGVRRRVEWSTAEERVTVTLDTTRNMAAPLTLEVLFLIDTTGSMGDEIAQIKATLLSVSQRVQGLQQRPELRYAAVLFRDLGDAYVTKVHPFTDDIQAFDAALQQIEAGGGGDYPESVNQGLDQAVSRMQWSKGTAKLVFLVGDAPPHMDYQGDVRYVDSALKAVATGIKIHSIAASGLEPQGSPSFRQVAQLTRGKFIFIEYGGDIQKSAASHGVGGSVQSNNLDDIVFEQIKGEIDVWSRRG